MRSAIVFVLGLFLLLTMSVAHVGCLCPPAVAVAAAARAVQTGAGLTGCALKASLAKVCGTPAGAPCKQESATRVCFGRQSALAAPKQAQPQ
jgi:hypothetical protein